MTQRPDTPHGAGGGGAFGFVRNGYSRAEAHDLTTGDVEGATVYGRDDEKIGTVRALKVGADDRITDAVIDVGGFLGLGAHSVLLPFSQLTVLRATAGSDLRVHLDTTKERLEALPPHGA